MCRTTTAKGLTAFLFIGAALLIPILTVRAKSPSPLALHPENPHYFLWENKPTILITSGEHYGALLNLDFDFRRYFKTLAADGLNHTRIFSGTYREVPGSFGITDNPLAPQPNRYISPWTRTETDGYFDGGGKFDLNSWDKAYFKRLNQLMKAADDAGVIIEFTLFCPLYKEILWQASPMNHKNNVNDIGKCKSTESLTLLHTELLNAQLAFVRKVVTKLNPFGNLYFEICNEPYFGGVTMEWQHRIADEITAVESKLPNQHLISMNIANGAKKVEKPHPAVSIFNFHYCTPPNTVAMNYHLNKVIGENETGFRGSDDLLYRTECWDFLIAGGGLYNNLDYSFTPKTPDGTLTNFKSPGGGSPALRKQLGICKEFFYSMDFIHMKPDNSVIKSVSDKLTASALIEPGKSYAIYLHVPLPKKPKNISDHTRDNLNATLSLELPQNEYTTEWIDTKTGKAVKTESFTHKGGNRELKSPPFSNDIVLRITAQ